MSTASLHAAYDWVLAPKCPEFVTPQVVNRVIEICRPWCLQEALGIPQGTIKATVLIETLPAAFEMDEILYELRQVSCAGCCRTLCAVRLDICVLSGCIAQRHKASLDTLGARCTLVAMGDSIADGMLCGHPALQHSSGLNCGRWDYIFSFIKTMRADPKYIMPDRCASVPIYLTQFVVKPSCIILQKLAAAGQTFVSCGDAQSRSPLETCSSSLPQAFKQGCSASQPHLGPKNANSCLSCCNPAVQGQPPCKCAYWSKAKCGALGLPTTRSGLPVIVPSTWQGRGGDDAAVHEVSCYLPFCRAEVGMTQPCMRAYTQLVIKTCHKRGVHAMGGMAAQIPIKNDPEANKVSTFIRQLPFSAIQHLVMGSGRQGC